MSAQELWVRSLRGYSDKPGPWHLVLAPANRSWFGSLATECDSHPTQRHQRLQERPTESLCRKCEKAAGLRQPPEKGGAA